MSDAEVIQVGNLYPDTPRFKNRTAGRVYDVDGISPTINTCQGGGKIPMIVVYEDRPNNMPKQQGGGVQPSLQDRIYDVEGCSTAITTSFLPNIAEPIICAMRGRNPDNPSERTKSNGRYRQRLEMNDNGTSNTITSVQKDNLVVEPRIIEVGRVKEGKHQQDMVQHEEGICRCICTGHHASTPHLLKTLVSEPQVLTSKRTEFGKAIRKQYESHEIEMSRHDMTTMEPRTDGVSNTLTSAQKDNYLAIPEATSKGYAEAHEGDSVNLAVPNSKTRRGRVGKQMANTLDTGCQQGVEVEDRCIQIGNILPDTPNMSNRSSGRIYSNEACCPSLMSRDFKQPKMIDDTYIRYRIRKLTPRECFRLMGVDDADIDKIQDAGISNSQQYKMAGNSIVVDTLYYILRKLFVDKGCEKEGHQQTLF